MQEKKRDLAGKIALAELTFLEQKRGTAETDDEKRKREEWEKEKEKIKDTLEWEIEKSEFAKRWEANELDRLHYLALVGDAAALAVRIEERKREYLAEQEQKNQAEKKKAALQSAMKDKMEVDSAKKKEEDDKQGMAAPPHTTGKGTQSRSPHTRCHEQRRRRFRTVRSMYASRTGSRPCIWPPSPATWSASFCCSTLARLWV